MNGHVLSMQQQQQQQQQEKGWRKIILREINLSTCTLFLQTKEGFSIRTAALYKHTLDTVNNVSWLHNKNVV